jgi:hypothetical protein
VVGLGVVRPRRAALLFESVLEGRAGGSVLAARLVDETEDLLQLGPHRRRSPEALQRARLRALQELSDRHAVAVGPHRRVRRLEEVDQEPHDLLGGVALLLRRASLCGQDTRLPGRDCAERSQAHEERPGRRYRQPVPPHELADALGERVRLGEHGLSLEETAEETYRRWGSSRSAVRTMRSRSPRRRRRSRRRSAAGRPCPTASLGGVAVVGWPSPVRGSWGTPVARGRTPVSSS